MSASNVVVEAPDAVGELLEIESFVRQRAEWRSGFDSGEKVGAVRYFTSPVTENLALEFTMLRSTVDVLDKQLQWHRAKLRDAWRLLYVASSWRNCVLRAYFDASTRENGTFCVAGYAFKRYQLRHFDREWLSLFSLYGGCHMRELTSRTGRFKAIARDEQDRLLKGAVEIINSRISFGVVMSCSLPEIHELLPKWIKGFEHAYPVCCHLAITSLVMLVSKTTAESIKYYFESGDEYAGSAEQFIGRVNDTPELKRSYQHASHSFIPKAEALALQAADLLAWEWAKFRDETLERRVRPMRKSLLELLGPDGQFKGHQYAGQHISGAGLQKFCAQVQQLGLLQLKEEGRL